MSQGYPIDESEVGRPPRERGRARMDRRGRFSLILGAATFVFPTVPTQRPSTIRLRTSLFREATEIVDREFASDLSLDDIARRVASSRRQLQRAYAEIGGTTFRDHLTAVRMQKAAAMLATRALTVREVAHRVGYRQPAQFAKAFRRRHGVAPSDYRAGGPAAGRFAREGLRPQAASGAA